MWIRLERSSWNLQPHRGKEEEAKLLQQPWAQPAHEKLLRGTGASCLPGKLQPSGGSGVAQPFQHYRETGQRHRRHCCTMSPGGPLPHFCSQGWDLETVRVALDMASVPDGRGWAPCCSELLIRDIHACAWLQGALILDPAIRHSCCS